MTSECPTRQWPLALLVVLAVSGGTTPPAWHRDAVVALSIPTTMDLLDAGSAPSSPSSSAASVRRVAAVFRDLDLPLPDPIQLHAYESPALFERGLIVTAKLSPSTAREIRRFAVGVTIDETLLVLESESRQGRLPWMRLLAHEMTHLAQIELAGGEERGARWLAEGMAEWVAFDVLERLGIAGTGAERAAILGSARLMLDTGLPPLARLGDAGPFIGLIRRAGAAPVYHLALLLVDRLVERHEFRSLVDYFRARATGEPRRASFERVFGESPEAFARAVRSTFAGEDHR